MYALNSVNRLTYRQADRRTDEGTDGRTDGTDRQTDRQYTNYINIKIHVYVQLQANRVTKVEDSQFKNGIRHTRVL